MAKRPTSGKTKSARASKRGTTAEVKISHHLERPLASLLKEARALKGKVVQQDELTALIASLETLQASASSNCRPDIWGSQLHTEVSDDREEAVKYRRAPTLVSYWDERRLIVENYRTGRRAPATPILLQILDTFADWRTVEAFRTLLPNTSARDARRLVRALERATLLERFPGAGTERAWGPWLPHAGLLHFGTKDEAYNRRRTPTRDAGASVPGDPPCCCRQRSRTDGLTTRFRCRPTCRSAVLAARTPCSSAARGAGSAARRCRSTISPRCCG